ncbi:hypothetical protein QT383_18725 [Stenotrophomonas rhizophila]
MAKRTSADGAKVRLIGDSTLCADMPTLSDDAVNDFVEKISLLQEDAHPDVVIRSAGGRVDLGMTMGEAIQRRRASVYAFGFCGSSCANYVFLPASRRVILKDTLLVFHGGLYRSILDSRDLTEEGKERTVASLSRQGQLCVGRVWILSFLNGSSNSTKTARGHQRDAPERNLSGA